MRFDLSCKNPHFHDMLWNSPFVALNCINSHIKCHPTYIQIKCGYSRKTHLHILQSFIFMGPFLLVIRELPSITTLTFTLSSRKQNLRRASTMYYIIRVFFNKDKKWYTCRLLSIYDE